MRLGEQKIAKTETIPSGAFSLDLALGVGGLPRGRTVELYGPEMSGKSTLTLHTIAELQKRGGKAAYIDAEHAFDIDYAKKLGVKTDDLLLSQPDSGEEALNILESLVRSGIIDLIVVDSVAALTPRAEIEGEMGDQFMGLQARMMGQALRKLTAITSKSKAVIIFINQIRMKIGVMFGCLNYKSKVNLANGETEWIGRIVNQKKKLQVLSYNWRKNEIVPKQITAWYRNGKANKFIQITAYKPSGNGKTQFSCTPNHPILTLLGWRRADQLRVDDHILIAVPYRLSPFQYEIIRGSLLGDGALSPLRKKSGGVRFRIGHGAKQKQYLLWKASLFKNIKHCIYKNQKKGLNFDITPLAELYDLRQKIYQGKYKYLTADFVANLTPLSLAVWYMDDGYLDIRDKTKTKGRIAICVERIHPSSRLLLQGFLKTKYDIQVKIRYQGGKAGLYFDQHNSDKFLFLIRRHIYPIMDYKLLPKYRGGFFVQPSFSETVIKPFGVPILKINIKPPTRSMIRFDIGVRGAHNFLADGAIVHNSPETTPGGRALKFFASVRIDIRAKAKLKKGEEIVGQQVQAKVVKNKVAPPFKTAEFDIIYGEGISYEGDVLNTGLKYGVVAKSGNTYNFGKEKLGVGLEAAKAKLKEDKKLLEEIKKQTLAAAQT